jgi:hypothetical protein
MLQSHHPGYFRRRHPSLFHLAPPGDSIPIEFCLLVVMLKKW